MQTHWIKSRCRLSERAMLTQRIRDFHPQEWQLASLHWSATCRRATGPHRHCLADACVVNLRAVAAMVVINVERAQPSSCEETRFDVVPKLYLTVAAPRASRNASVSCR
jgi:hypothetical protein